VGDTPQNIYDDAHFFDGYSQMERFGAGWQQAMEQPVFVGLLPPLEGLRVLDLGCGAGQLARFVAEQGAAEVIGVDVSERMLRVAESSFSHPRVRFRRAAIEDVGFAARRFDLVMSSLAFHYVADYRRLVHHVSLWLRPGGTLVFSTEHPLYTGRLPDHGWVTDASGHRTGWAIDRYSDEGLRTEHWFVDGVRKYHRPMSTLLNGLVDAGLRIERVLEPVPDAARLATRPHDQDETRRPMFLLIRASWPGGAAQS
jgi:SAM-dependent methyltransferase